ncbi:MAG: enoyl-CoA hydratase-related protein [Pseudonocardia sp.]|nr:enoyl-CoA hydratase-related protein [Pseudonocardia sp.]
MDGTVTAAPAELARRLYDALADGDAAALDALLDPAFVGVLADGMPDGGGTHEGAEAMCRDGWGAIGRGFRARAVPQRFLELADGRLLVTGHYSGAGRGGGTALDAAFAHLFTVGDGRFTHLEQYTDTARWRDAASPFTTLTLRVTDGVADVRLNRPEHGNAIDVAMARDLREAATRIAEDSSVRVVLLRGNGPMLTTGGDIDLFSGLEDAELPPLLRRMIDDYHQALERLAEIDAPLVVGVRGAAAGGGLGLVCTADYAIAATDAVFAVGYGRIGLTADGGTTWYLPRLVGMRRAQEMFLLNRRLTADEACQWGLVNRVVPADDVDAEAETVAAGLAAGPTRAFGGMRRLLRRSYETPLGDQLHAERNAIVDVAATGDAAEGITAFAERRRPRFTGR